MNLYHATYLSPIGVLRIESTRSHITGITFTDEHIQECDATVPISQAIAWLDRYFIGEPVESGELPLAPEGTVFQKQVWERLCRIPYGQTRTYHDISKQIAAIRGTPKMSAQAIGQACRANPILIVIPCHRVIGTGNRITGYRGGIFRKQHLLLHEQNYGFQR